MLSIKYIIAEIIPDVPEEIDIQVGIFIKMECVIFFLLLTDAGLLWVTLD